MISRYKNRTLRYTILRYDATHQMDTFFFDALMDTKKKELLEIYDAKMSKTKNKKLTPYPEGLDFNSKKLISRINATFDTKLKNSAAYKKKCEEDARNDTSNATP